MDVTPQLIEQIDFSEKFRGYDQDQVDDFLERVGATIAELNKSLSETTGRLDDAEGEIARLRAASGSDAARVAESPLGDEEEMAQAARTLMLARRTADAAIADARSEAQQLLNDAQSRLEAVTSEANTESERLLSAARSEAAETIRNATLEAERAATTRREEIQREISDLELRRTLLASDVAALEGRVTRYRDNLTQVHGAVGALLEDPSVLRNEPPHEFVADNPVVEAMGYDSDPPAGAIEDVGDDDQVAELSTSLSELPQASNEVQVSFEELREDSGRVDVVPSESDPWGPGSWSDAVSIVRTDDSQDSDEPASAGPSTGSYGGLSQDRYLRDLDEAVNQPVANDDEAMSAFFEGDAEAEAGRFGRRR